MLGAIDLLSCVLLQLATLLPMNRIFVGESILCRIIHGSSEQISSSISSCSWNRVTMRCPSFLTGALKQQGTAYVYILHTCNILTAPKG